MKFDNYERFAMRWLLLGALVLFSLAVSGQTIKKQKGVDIIIQDTDQTTPPDSIPCTTCPPGAPGISPTVTVGTTTTLPSTNQATVTDSDPGPNAVLNFGIPQGIQGPPGGSTGGGTQTRHTFDVTAYGANPNDNISDLAAFQAATDAARAVCGKVIIPSPGNGLSYILAGTWNIIPDASNQTWIDVEMLGGRAGAIKYTGPSNAPVVKIIGLKGGIFTGLNIAIENGRTNVQIFDVITPNMNQGSTSFVTFNNFYLNLGNGQHNIGIRTGSGAHGGDISNYNFQNIIVYGGGGQRGASILGQYGFQNLGNNTLSQVWIGGFVASCDRAYSGTTWDGSQRGNGSVAFFGLGGAHNNIDFQFAWEQSYKITGGRWENGQKFLLVKEGGQSNISVSALTIHDYHAANNIIELLSGTSITLDQVQVVWTNQCNCAPGKLFNPVVLMNSPRVSSLRITGGGYSSSELYRKAGGAAWNVTVDGAAKINVQYPTGFFPNEFGVNKP